MKNLFGPWTIRWWETSILKVTLIAFGVAVGSYWPGIFREYVTLLVIVFAIGAIYTIWTWYRQ